MKSSVVFVLFSLAFPFFSVTAQTANYSILQYTTDNGLPQSSVKSIVFDRQGYCWMATEMGLVRFDGYSFKTFNSYNIPGCRADRIRLVGVDTTGHVYARNELRQIFTIDAADGCTPVPHLLSEGSAISVVDGYVISDAVASKVIKGSEGIFYLYNLPGSGVYCRAYKAVKYAMEDSLVTIYNIQNKDGIQSIPVGNLFLLFEKNKPVKAWKNGILQNNFKDIQGPATVNKSYQKGEFFCYSTQGQSYLFTGNTLYGLYEQRGEVMSKVLLENINIPVISSIYYSAEQRKYYIGSLVSGLYIVSLSDFHFPKQAEDAPSEGFYSQVMTSEGNIICQRYLYRKNKGPVKLALNKLVGATLFLKGQKLYYGNEPVLFRYDLVTKANKKLLDLDSRPSSIYFDRTDSAVTIISTSFAIGKIINDSLKVLKKLPGGSEIMNTVQIGKDSFLVVTKSGIKWYDFARDKVYRSVLDSFYTRSVYPEPNGKVWISTYNQGFYLYENDSVYNLPVQDYEALRTIHCFINDGRGNFWLPTNDGLFVVKRSALLDYVHNRKRDIYYYMYSVHDNLRTNEFNGGCAPAYLWTNDSMLSLPSIAGLVQFYPHEMNQMIPDKDIYIDEIRLNDSLLLLPTNKRLGLKPDYGRLTIKVSTPYFGARENLKLVYKIRGMDAGWRPIPDDGKIVLEAVAPGKYDFLVASLNGKELNDHNSLKFSVAIEPWFYNTWWFYTLIGLIIIAAVILFAVMRVNILKARNSKLQAIIHEQTEDLRKAVQQLGLSEKALMESNRTKDRIITLILHDLRSPIRFLHLISEQLAKQYDKMSGEEVKEALSILSSSTGSLNSFTDQFLSWAASQHEGFKVVYKTFPLRELFEELGKLYSDIVIGNGNKLEIYPGNITIHTDRNILSAIIRNLLDNANKNTTNGVIRLTANVENDKIVISIADTGTGLSPEAIEASFDKNKTVGLYGNGSIIVLSLLQKIEGRLSIKPGEEAGTIFQITFNNL